MCRSGRLEILTNVTELRQSGGMSSGSTEGDEPQIDPVVAAFFATGVEQDRLTNSSLEIERNKAILARHLPAKGRILDVGGGTGIYASWLAAWGHQVDLVEPIPLHVERARETARSGAHFEVHLGDARKLHFSDAIADAVLLMGPLYYLPDATDRRRALCEAFRVLRPGGVLAATALGPYSLLSPVLLRNLWQEGVIDNVMESLQSGILPSGILPSGDLLRLRTHRPEELRAEVQEAGFAQIEVLTVNGFFALPRIYDNLRDSRAKKALLTFLSKVESDPGIVGMSGQLHAIGRRPEGGPAGYP